jgi:hypothetical protein
MNACSNHDASYVLNVLHPSSGVVFAEPTHASLCCLHFSVSGQRARLAGQTVLSAMGTGTMAPTTATSASTPRYYQWVMLRCLVLLWDMGCRCRLELVPLLAGSERLKGPMAQKRGENADEDPTPEKSKMR